MDVATAWISGISAVVGVLIGFWGVHREVKKDNELLVTSLARMEEHVSSIEAKMGKFEEKLERIIANMQQTEKDIAVLKSKQCNMKG